ncbi:MAG: helicase-related protein, partial [Sedimentisphaerales bacterium]|nr:helicase-related protein [Sedimentisphaerales bacterium]
QSQGHVVEQLVRPTGLVDPIIELRPIENQVEELVIEVIRRKSVGQRVLVTTLTKKMAEALTEYLNTPEKIDALIKRFQDKEAAEQDSETPYQTEEYLNTQKMAIGKINPIYYRRIQPFKNLKEIPKPKVAYLHSDIETLDRSDILDDLRKGEYDVLVGINLLREGLDLPEVSLVAILDADKEGFLRSGTSLVQTMGRAARHENGRAILFADNMTKSMKRAIEETQRRRETQVAYNKKHGITPTSINKPIREKLLTREETHADKQRNKGRIEVLKGTTIRLNKSEVINLSVLDPESMTPAEKAKLTKKLNRRMKQAAVDLDFELATLLRDTIQKLS